MQYSSSPDSSPTVAENIAGANPLPLQPVILSERSLTLLALVRILIELFWFQQLAGQLQQEDAHARRTV